MAKKKEKLMIIDGNALIHRSFHALPPTMTKKDGTPTNAVYGFVSFLLKAVRDLKPEYVVLTLDKKGPTFRHKRFKEYKAKRVKAPDELYAQIPLVRDVAKSFNIPVFEKTGFEADDLIGTIAETIKKEKLKIKNIIVTGDKDTLQLVNDYTEVYSMSRGLTDSLLYDEEMVKEKMGVRPDQVIDYKALRGDPSDNIPGVPGVGDKTAVELIGAFGSLEKIYDHVTRNTKRITEIVTPRIIGLLKEHKDSAYLSQELATIKCDVEEKFDLEATRFRDLDKDKVIAALTDLEFKSLLPRVQDIFEDSLHVSKQEKEEKSEDKFARNQKQFKYNFIDSEKKFSAFYKKLKSQKSFAFDTETSGVDPMLCDLLGVSFSWKKGEAHYVQLKIKKEKLKKNSSQGSLFGGVDLNTDEKTAKKWLEKMGEVFADKAVKKFAHNGKFDIRVLKAFLVQVENFQFDTMIASYLLNPGSRGHSLDAVSLTELGFEKISKVDLLGSGRDKLTFPEVEDEKMSLYSCEDADCTRQLVTKLKPRLKEQHLEKLFNKVEIPLVTALANMEDNGVLLDTSFLKKMSVRMARKIKQLEKKIHDLAGEEFNIKSTKQLKEILFEKLEISTLNVKKTKTGFSTAADELEKLKNEHPIIILIQEYRELTKLTSTYVDALPKLINPNTDRIHTSFNQTIAATGRLSSTHPNLQNIPIRTKLGREIRKAFVAPKGSKLIALDYSQIELRLAAHMSGDKKMIQAFKNKADIHTQTAAEINQVSPEAVDKNMRREAKAINFGILYGQGPHGLSQTADIPYARARDFIDNYFVVFSEVKKYIDSEIKKARELGYVETLLGRRRYLPEINSSVVMVRKGAERMAMNTPLQGTAADMMKIAIIEVEKQIDPREAKLLLTVHDEVVLEVKNKQVEKVIKKVTEIMEGVIKLKVPVLVDAKAGQNWGEMEAIKN